MHIKKNKDKIELNKFGGTSTMNIGCDIIKNKRLENKEQRFIDFILTEKEQIEFKKKGNLYLCGRFAAKEAIMKAMPNTKKYCFLDFEILTDNFGSPYCSNNSNIKLSISHEKKYTMAVAIIY